MTNHPLDDARELVALIDEHPEYCLEDIEYYEGIDPRPIARAYVELAEAAADFLRPRSYDFVAENPFAENHAALNRLRALLPDKVEEAPK